MDNNKPQELQINEKGTGNKKIPGHIILNQSDDPDWEKYLNYPALDLKNITIDDLEFLKSTYGKPTEHCDMCNNQPVNNIPWYKRDQKMLFRAKDIP